jgi:translation initiation factor 2D
MSSIVYALWKVADLLPPLVVHAPVSEFVMNGADVMLPGVILTMEIAKSLLKGQKRCVYANGNPMPFAVGEICTDLAEIEKFGKKGKALKLLHVFGDELYKMGPQSVPNEGFLPTRIIRLDISSTAQDENDTCSNDGILLQQQQQQQQQENKEEKIDLGDLKIIIEKETCLPPAVPVNMGTSIDKEHIDGNIEMTKEKMDFLVEKTFLQALKTRVKTKQLPMLASTFQSTILLPSRPVGTNLNFKQSTYKKLSVFLKQMETKGLVQVSEKDGIQSIVSICRSHP